MEKYERPEILASFEVQEIVEEAAACEGYDWVPTESV